MEILWLLLKKLYRFDGEVQDGFEEEAYLETGEDRMEILERNLKQFGKRRNEKNKKYSKENYKYEKYIKKTN